MNDTPEPGRLPPLRLDISRLQPEQVTLLRTVLDAGKVPFAIAGSKVVAAANYARDLERAVQWVSKPGLPADGSSDEADADSFDLHAYDESFDDPEYRSRYEPLVAQPRAPLRDGRQLATRWRRLAAGAIDTGFSGSAVAIAAHAGAPVGALVLALFVYTVLPTALWGWTPAKWCLGIRVVSKGTLRSPNMLQALVRWAIPIAPAVASWLTSVSGDAIGVIGAVIYAPIVLALRGVHDYAAGTVVVESTTAGPSGGLVGVKLRKNG